MTTDRPTIESIDRHDFIEEHETQTSSDWQLSTSPGATDDDELQVTLESTRLSNTELTTENSDILRHSEAYEVQGRDNINDDDGIQDTTTSHFINDTSSSNNGFISFMNTIQNSLVSKAKNTLNSKLRVLKNLRDNILFEIQNRMDTLWKPKDVSREARGHYEDDDYHMDFPSNEGALMTISFLTFAVYLIKLVMKLIYALKSKSQTVSTTVTPTGTGIIIGRRKRDTSLEDANKILQLIEEYSLI